MKIVALACSHNCPIDFILRTADTTSDVLVLAGDVMNKGNKDEFRKFVTAVGKNGSFKHKIYVPGNHDTFAAQETAVARSLCDANKINMLIDESINIDGKTFYGTPWCKIYYGWSFMKTFKELDELYSKIPENVDVLISHDAPLGYLDVVAGKHVGNSSLLKAISKKKPEVHIFGHIHEGYGEKRVFLGQKDGSNDKYSRLYNVSVLDGGYSLKNKPKIIEV